MRLVLLALFAASLPTLATAIPILEGSVPGGDYGDTFATRTVLPPQADVFSGTATFVPDFPGFPGLNDPDFVTFTDLVPGADFTLLALFANSAFDFLVRVQSSTGANVIPLVSVPSTVIAPTVLAGGIVPSDGELVLVIRSPDGGIGYTLQLDAARVAVPEPTAALLVASGLALLARRRRSTG